MRILIVEDNSDDLVIVREELEGVSGGALDLVHASSLAEAAKRARAEPFDAALLDLGLPDALGLETLARFGQLAPGLPVVVFTGEDDEGRALEAVSLGAQDYVIKGESSGRQLLRALRFAVERRKLLDEVTEARAKLQGILEGSPGSFLVVEASDLTIVDASGGYLKATRTHRDEIVGRRLFDVFPDDPSEPGADGTRNLRHSLEWVLRYGEPHTMPAQRYPIPVPEEDGGGFEERWWSTVNAPVFDAEGSVRFVIHRVEDVTEYVQMRLRAGAGEDEPLLQEAREKMEADLFLRAREVEALNRKLEESRRLLDVAGEVARIGGWAVDVGGDRVDLSDQVCAIHGLPRGSRPQVAEALDFYHPEDRSLVAEHFHRLVEEGEPYDLEVRFVPRGRPRAGREIWIRTIGIPVRDSNGQVVRVQGAFQDLTPAKEAEASVERETRRFHELAEAMPQVVWTAGPDGMVDFFTSDLLAYTGLSAQELLGEGWGQVVHPDDLPLALERWTRSLETGERYQVDFRIRRHDGVYHWHLLQAECARDEEGAIIRWYGSATDVDDRRRIEEKAARLGERMTTTLESITDAFLMLDREWRFTFLNGTAQRALDRSAEELLGKSIWDEFPATVGSIFETQYRRAAEEGVSVQFEGYYPLPLDAWYDVRAYPSDEGIALYFHDVTERRAAEARIREQAALLDNTQDAILVRTLDHRVRFANSSAERLYGWSREEFLGSRVDELLYTEPHDFQEATRIVLEEGEWTGELQQQRKDGSVIWVEGRWSLIHGDRGEPTGVMAVNTDLTERKKLQDQFHRAQRLDSIGALAGGIAHDLNNILAPILMSVGLLRGEMMGGDDVEETLEVIEASTQRGADMVRQVLSFSRGLDGARMPFDLEKVCLDLERVVRDTFPKDISLEVDVPKELWPLHGDPTQIHQVLMNLVLNARDSMPDGGTIRLTVENRTIDTQYAAFVEGARSGPYVQMTVADTGVGMSPDLLVRVFDPFFTTKEVGKGTGLGLSSVDAIVRSHGGYLHVYSEEGVGTSFQVLLPVRPEGDEPPPMPTPSSGSLRQGNAELILVVDDESSVRTITRQTLEAFGYRVLTAPDGADAVAVYDQCKDRVDLVLTDHSMPIMDGPSLIRALYGRNPEVRIIVMSGLGLGNGAPRAEPGVEGFLRKPYTAETLVEMVQRVLPEDPSQMG